MFSPNLKRASRQLLSSRSKLLHILTGSSVRTQRLSWRAIRRFSVDKMDPNQTPQSIYNENQGQFENILGVFDENDDGLLQYNEFIELTQTLNISKAQFLKIQVQYFPTKNEELNMNNFGELFAALVDLNDDRLLQHDEFVMIVAGLDLDFDKIDELRERYFPSRNENLDAATFLKLMEEVDAHVDMLGED